MPVQMPASKRSHVVAVLRKNLALRQPELAKMVGCSVATIQSIEVGRLKLSESLASRIWAATGCDRDWLLRNDVSVPMPPRPFFLKGVASSGLQSYVMTITLLIDVFSRLFAEARKLDKTGARDELELLLSKELEALKKTIKEPGAVPLQSASKDVFQYFDAYPDELPTELENLLNLDYLIEIAPECDEPKENPQPPRQGGGTESPRPPKARRRTRQSP
jgi:DNA-binding XRE family transcriptional regulator